MVDDRPARPAAERAVEIDNDGAHVSQWRFPLTAATGWRRHEFAFVEIEPNDGGCS